MADFTGLIDSIKRAALDAVAASSPVAIVFGEVTAASPLCIVIEQKQTLEDELILSRNVTNFSVKTEAGEVLNINNALQYGDNVILFKLPGGQRYLVIDRLG